MNEFDDLGKQIEKSVNSSVNWINDLINDIHSGVASAAMNVQSSQAYQQAQQERARVQAERQRQLQERTRAKQEYAKKIKSVSTGANFIRAFGGFFLGIFAAAFISVGFENIFDGDITTGVIGFIMAVVSAWGTISLFKKNSALNRYVKYINIIGDQNYINIEELVTTTGYSHNKVVKDLKSMIAANILKQAHIDPQEKYLMVTNEVYHQYLDAQKSYDARAAVQEMREKEDQAKAREAAGERDPELVKALEQGRDYIKQIKTANDKIPGEEITKKLTRLEQISVQIFDAVDKHPEKLPEIRKFMEYYMPTTLKLVNSYHEFDIQPVQGENILKAKREIEDTLDMINMAFENLSDRLYEADTMDVKADISVLKTLLAQEGLKDGDFKL